MARQDTKHREDVLGTRITNHEIECNCVFVTHVNRVRCVLEVTGCECPCHWPTHCHTQVVTVPARMKCLIRGARRGSQTPEHRGGAVLCAARRRPKCVDHLHSVQQSQSSRAMWSLWRQRGQSFCPCRESRIVSLVLAT